MCVYAASSRPTPWPPHMSSHDMVSVNQTNTNNDDDNTSYNNSSSYHNDSNNNSDSNSNSNRNIHNSNTNKHSSCESPCLATQQQRLHSSP